MVQQKTSKKHQKAGKEKKDGSQSLEYLETGESREHQVEDHQRRLVVPGGGQCLGPGSSRRNTIPCLGQVERDKRHYVWLVVHDEDSRAGSGSLLSRHSVSGWSRVCIVLGVCLDGSNSPPSPLIR